MTAPEPAGYNVQLPYRWAPRPYQLPTWHAWERGVKRTVLIWHRRAGKDLTSINWMLREAMRRPGLYWHISPTYEQGRKIVWEGKDRDGRPFLDYIPKELVLRKRDDTMSVWLQGGSQLQLVGADNPNSLVGPNPVGIIFSEYSLQNPACWNLLRPILAENGGWAIFCYTPRGRNHGHKLYQAAKRLEATWHHSLLTVDDTQAITLEAINDDRESGMPEETVQQEYWCSFDAPLVGSYYGKLISDAEKEGRIGRVPWDPRVPVITAWDLGFGDMTAIWFMQKVGPERRIIDFYCNSGQGLEHYVKHLREKPYVYDPAILPHDAAVHELSTAKSRQRFLRELGVASRVLPKYAFNDRVNAVRSLIPRCWFDDEKCGDGLHALREYMKKRKEGETGPKGEPIFLDEPLHNWASHPADAFGYLALGEDNRKFGKPGEGQGERKPTLAAQIPIV